MGRNAKVRPPWLEQLNKAGREPEWLDVLVDVDEVAVRLFLARHRLPGATVLPRQRQLAMERVGPIRTGLAEGKITLDDLARWRVGIVAMIEPVDRINEFPSKEGVFEAFDRSLPGGLDEVALTILRRLWTGELALQKWVEFIDRQKEQNPRDLFLYRLPRDVKCPEPLANYVEEAVCTELAEVMVDNGDRVYMRWVAPRGGRRRSAFTRIDLERGVMELQLEHPNRGRMSELVAERDRIARAVAEILGASPELLHLETAMRELMSDDRLRLEAWRVRRPGGGEASGKREAELFEKIRPGLDLFYALELKGKWRISAEQTVTVNLDTRTDAITVLDQCPRAFDESLVATIRQHLADAAVPVPVPVPVVQPVVEESEETPHATTAPPPMSVEKMAELAELRALVEKLIAYQQRLGQTEVAIQRLPGKTKVDLLSDSETLQKALEIVGVRYLGAVLYVMCPATGTSVHVGGREVVFERVSDIPETVLCENEEGEQKTHFTAGNIWLRVIGPTPQQPAAAPEPQSAPPPTAVVANTEQEERAHRRIRRAWMYYVVAFFPITLFFVWLLDTYPGLTWFIVPCFIIMALGPVAWIWQTYGPAAFEGVTKWLPSLFKS